MKLASYVLCAALLLNARAQVPAAPVLNVSLAIINGTLVLIPSNVTADVVIPSNVTAPVVENVTIAPEEPQIAFPEIMGTCSWNIFLSLWIITD
jgi:hypothetical protein